MALKIATYNCHSFKTSVNDIRQLCNTHDIILLQETWLLESELPLLGQVNTNFYYKGISSMDCNSKLFTGRPFGGLAILWSKKLGTQCTPVMYGSQNNILGLTITMSQVSYLLLNVYMPYCCGNNREEFLLQLHHIDSIISTADTPFIFVAGDFNADTTRDHLFGRKLTQFCQDNDLVIADTLRLQNTFTFLSSAHQSMSWLDHVVCTTSAYSLVSHCQVLYDVISSDHFPLSFTFTTNVNDSASSNTHAVDSCDSSHSPRVKWDSLSSQQLQQYSTATEDELYKIVGHSDLNICSNCQCSCVGHRNAIDQLYQNICSCLHNACKTLSCNSSKHKHKLLPGWDECCKDRHRVARESFLLWRRQGSPRQGLTFDDMKRTRALFKLSLRLCKKRKEESSLDNLALHFLSKNSKAFWNQVNHTSGKKLQTTSTNIGGATSAGEICSMWRDHFSNLLNSDTSKKHQLSDLLACSDIADTITAEQVKSSISKLKKSSSPGSDGLSGEHFIYAHKNLYDLLSVLFNAMITHNYLPKCFMDTVLIPILKSNKGDLTSCDNYRPIALTNVMSKLLELIILHQYEDLLCSQDHQFGFKKDHSTDQCIFVIKELIDMYSSTKSPIYLCFLDASKAFDRINHHILFRKLLDRGVPVMVVRLLYTWYSNQRMRVKWGEHLSQDFPVSNGVRQGGNLSPALFNLYLEELSATLSKKPAGCFVDNLCVNHIFYADDAVLLAPSPSALQTLISTCADYGNNNDIIYNPSKSVCMCYLPACLQKCNVPSMFLNSTKLPWVQDHKYLGYFFSTVSGDAKDMKRQISYIYSKGNVLVRKFSKCKEDIKVTLFKSYCYSLYCCHLWTHYTCRKINMVRVAYNDAFRFLFGVDRRSHVSPHYLKYTIDCFDVLRRKSMVNFRRRLYNSKNSIILKLIYSPFFLNVSKLYNTWSKIIF